MPKIPGGSSPAAVSRPPYLPHELGQRGLRPGARPAGRRRPFRANGGVRPVRPKAGKGLSDHVPRAALRPPPAPVSPAGDSARARHAGFRPSRTHPPAASCGCCGHSGKPAEAAPLARSPSWHARRRLVAQNRCLHCGRVPPGRRRQMLRRLHRAPPRQLPQGETQTPPPAEQSRAMQGLRNRHPETRPQTLRSLPDERPGGQPHPQATAA